MKQLDKFIEHELASRRIPQPLREALLYALVGGKRLRGHLTHASVLAWGGTEDQALKLALAVECAHACGLVHDDLPAMDNDLMRRGKPTVHAKFGEAMAILVGDALMSLTFEFIAASGHPHCTQMCHLAAKAVGPEGMMAGQHMDLHEQQTDLTQVFELHDHKTGKLFAMCVGLGMLCDSSHLSEDIWEMGRLMGISFQCVDDFDDVENDAPANQAQGSKNAAQLMSQEELMQLLQRNQESLEGYVQAHCPDPGSILPWIHTINWGRMSCQTLNG